MNKIKQIISTVIITMGMQYSYAQSGTLVDTSSKSISFYQKTIQNKKTIVQFIEYTLQQHHIPKALRNLALIESNFNKNAVSWANAAGIWQIIPSTATLYGLTVSKKIDQRFDIYKSTFAAAKNLSDLYNEYQDWRLVVAAYNCGRGNVNKAIIKAGSTRYEDFFRYLPAETINHVHKFLLACYATNELPAIMGGVPSPAADPIPEKEVPSSRIKKDKAGEPTVETEISGGYHLTTIASHLNISFEKLQSLNPDINEQLVKNGTAKLILPTEKMPDFLLKKTIILQQSITQ